MKAKTPVAEFLILSLMIPFFFLQWVLKGLDTQVINMVMQTGDKFLRDGNAHIALNFYREAVFLFPATVICNIREAQCLLALVSRVGFTRE